MFTLDPKTPHAHANGAVNSLRTRISNPHRKCVYVHLEVHRRNPSRQSELDVWSDPFPVVVAWALDPDSRILAFERKGGSERGLGQITALSHSMRLLSLSATDRKNPAAFSGF